MTAPPCPKLATQLYQEVYDTTESVESVATPMFYLLGAILTGNRIDVNVYMNEPDFNSLIKSLPSWPAIHMYCTPKQFTQDELTAALVAIKLST